jgi:dTDP-glucose pyrophosphorylase
VCLITSKDDKEAVRSSVFDCDITVILTLAVEPKGPGIVEGLLTAHKFSNASTGLLQCASDTILSTAAQALLPDTENIQDAVLTLASL